MPDLVITNSAQPSPEESTRSVIVERLFTHPPARLWRALTEDALIAQWLMANDFAPTAGHKFQFRSQPMPQWNGIIDCQVLIVEPLRQLSYTWSALGLDSVVVFTLTPAPAGTLLRMEHSGFGPGQDAAYKGATYGWQKFIANLQSILEEAN
jgi:uncharacterized protein YndB with AHSA1/START domain